MTQIKNLKNSQGTEFYPKTHTKAVIDDNGYNIESRLDAMHDEINAAQLEIGAVPIDLTPTQGNTTHVVSSAGIKNALDVLKLQYGFTELMGQALLACMRNVAWASGDGMQYYNALEEVIYHVSEITSIYAVYEQEHYVYDISSLNEIKQDLTVYAMLGSSTSIPILNYTLSGELTVGTSVIAVSYSGFTTTINVTVTEYGTRMSYTMNDGVFLNCQFETRNAEYGWGITSIPSASSTPRSHFFFTYGTEHLHDYTSNTVLYYGVPVPKTATQVTVSITPATIEIGGYFIYANGTMWTAVASSTQSYVAGGYTKAFNNDEEKDIYLVIPSKSLPSNITGLTINFE